MVKTALYMYTKYLPKKSKLCPVSLYDQQF